MFSFNTIFTFFEKFSNEKLFNLAQDASRYAKMKIKMGSTWLENNDLTPEVFDSLYKISDKLYKLVNELGKNKLSLEHEVIKDYENIIEVSGKNYFGNCFWRACQALDYILHINPGIYVEIYEIENGDHAFLVFGRDRNSHPSLPETWGNAYICDPMEKENAVYKASEYRSKLKCFYQKDKKNYIEDFKHKKHVLKPIPYMNTDFFQKY
jgi:hypothetical protein